MWVNKGGNTLEEEVNYVVKSIDKLIDSGNNSKNIKITNISNNYNNTLKRISSLYNLKINIMYRRKVLI